MVRGLIGEIEQTPLSSNKTLEAHPLNLSELFVVIVTPAGNLPAFYAVEHTTGRLNCVFILK